MNRIALPPRFRGSFDLPDLEARADALNVIVSTEATFGRHWGWRVRVRRDEQAIEVRSSGERGDCGPLLPVIAGALHDFEAAYPAWTNDELVQIANQSGIEVQRA